MHPRQLSAEDQSLLNEQLIIKKGTFYKSWTGESVEVINEVKNLKCSNLDMWAEKESLLNWMVENLSSDPYWLKPTKYIEDHEYNARLDRIREIKRRHPTWIRNLEDNIPTYYGVLGVSKETPVKEIRKRYKVKKELSLYSDDILDDAHRTLKNNDLRKEYDSLLNDINILNRDINYTTRFKVIKEHDSWVKAENGWMIMEFLQRNHGNWFFCLTAGIPSFYDMLGLKNWRTERINDASIKRQIEEKKKSYPNASALFEISYNILLSPILRWEYEFMLEHFDWLMEEADDDRKDELEHRRSAWAKWDDKIDIITLLLSEHDKFHDRLKKWLAIINDKSDWAQYLPPKEKSFYTVLGLNSSELPKGSTDAEISKLLRQRYRQCERTVDVNYAYSVLKNKDLRDDYNWMLEHHIMTNKIYEILKLGEKEIGEEEMEDMLFDELLEEYIPDWR